MCVMQTLVILGNGFDLDLGWKTSFNDFYQTKKDKFSEYSGSSYIANMVEGEYWYNLEGYLRRCVLTVNRENIEHLNMVWQICSNFLLDYFANHRYIKNFVTKQDSCAFKFLREVKKSVVYTFNYTNPFKKENVQEPEIHFVHGKVEGSFNGTQMKLGVDEAVMDINPLANEDNLQPLIKCHENVEKDNLLCQLKVSDNIVFYGHSLSITDSDYFKRFFLNLINGKVKHKTLFFVVYNTKGLQQLKNNLKEYGVIFDELELSDNIVNIVFTSKGQMDGAFKKLLDVI